MVTYIYSKTPIYRGVWGQRNIRGKSGSAVNRGFLWLTLCMFSPIWGKGNGRGISGFAVNRINITILYKQGSAGFSKIEKLKILNMYCKT